MAALSRTAFRGCKPVKVKHLSSRTIHGPAQPTDKELYDEVAQYPEISPYRNLHEKNEAEHSAKVKAMGTVEEKQYYVNLPKFFGWKTWCMDTIDIPPASLPSTQFLTNTTVVEGLPSQYQNVKKTSEELASALAPTIKSALSCLNLRNEHGPDVPNDHVLYHEHHAVDPKNATNHRKRNTPFVTAVHRLITLGLNRTHLRTAANDRNPRNEAFWFRGPLDPERSRYHGRKANYERTKNWNRFPYKHTNPFKSPYDIDMKAWTEEKGDQTFQILGKGIYAQIRTGKGLDPFIPMTDELVKSGPVPLHDYLPNQSGWRRLRRRGTNLTGTWTGTETEFSYLVLADTYNKDKMQTDTAYNEESEHNERPDMLLSKTILHGFGMTCAQACNHGFSPFNDPTVPFTGQVILTDGKRWKVGAYQLNKTAMQGISETNDEMLRNVCWHLPEKQLYGQVNPETGEVSDFDMDVLSGIISMYLLEPQVSEVPNQDYLDPQKRHVYQLENEYNRRQFTNNHREMMSQAKKHEMEVDYKLINWHERLYRIKHPHIMFPYGDREPRWWRRRNLDVRGREFWDPEYRWYDNVPGAYVPRKMRTVQLDGKLGTGSTVKRDRAVVVTAPLPPDTKDA